MSAGIVIKAYGRPTPQGSKRHVGRGVMVEQTSKHLRPWRKAVTAAARDAAQYHDTLTGPVFVRITFSIARPAVHYRTGKFAHLLRDQAPPFPCNRNSGDIEKLVRACFDPITEAGVWVDDCLVADVRARKVWAGEAEQALDQPGVRIEIVPLLDLEETP